MERLSLSKLAEVIKCRRAEKNITQEQLSKLSSLNRNTIGRIERMDYIPSIPQLEKLADVLDFDLSILFLMIMKKEYIQHSKNHPLQMKNVQNLTMLWK